MTTKEIKYAFYRRLPVKATIGRRWRTVVSGVIDALVMRRDQSGQLIIYAEILEEGRSIPSITSVHAESVAFARPEDGINLDYTEDNYMIVP